MRRYINLGPRTLSLWHEHRRPLCGMTCFSTQTRDLICQALMMCGVVQLTTTQRHRSLEEQRSSHLDCVTVAERSSKSMSMAQGRVQRLTNRARRSSVWMFSAPSIVATQAERLISLICYVLTRRPTLFARLKGIALEGMATRD